MPSRLSSKHIIERGDLIFLLPRTRFQKLIAYFDGRYSHCGIALSSNLYLNMTKNGVNVASIPKNIEVYEFIDLTRQDKEKLISFLISKIDTVKYDFAGLFSFVFKFIPQNPRKFYCSEFITWGLFYIGLLPDRLQLSPSQLANQEFLRRKL